MIVETQRAERDLGDFVATIKRRWMWFLVPLIALPCLTVVLAISRPDVYVASNRVLLGLTAAQEAVDDTATNTGLLDRTLENEISLALSDAARSEVARQLGVEVEDLPQIDIARDGQADVLRFTVRERTPGAAADAANIWADAFVRLKQSEAEQSIGGALDRLNASLEEARVLRSEVTEESGQRAVLDAQIASLTDNIIVLELSSELALSGTARVITVANDPTSRANAPLSRTVSLALFAGLLIGIAAALSVESLDRTLSTEADIERMGVISLGVIPRPTRDKRGDDLTTMVRDAPESSQAEAHHKLRTAVEFSAVGIEMRTLLVTSANGAEGKTTTCVNLVQAIVAAGQRVVLVDCDLRRPRIGDVFGIENVPGLTDSVLSGLPLFDIAQPIPGHSENLVVIPSGTLPPSPATVISSAPFAKLIAELRQEADIVVIDTPPVLPVSDAVALSAHVDAALVVVEAGRTRRPDLERTLALLDKAGALVIGTVLVGAKPDTNSEYSYRHTES